MSLLRQLLIAMKLARAVAVAPDEAVICEVHVPAGKGPSRVLLDAGVMGQIIADRDKIIAAQHMRIRRRDAELAELRATVARLERRK